MFTFRIEYKNEMKYARERHKVNIFIMIFNNVRVILVLLLFAVVGILWNIDIDDCASSPCINGSCIDTGVLSYECTCQAGFTGRNCDMGTYKTAHIYTLGRGGGVACAAGQTLSGLA